MRPRPLQRLPGRARRHAEARCSATWIPTSPTSSLEVVALQRIAYQAADGLVLPLQATGTSGMECGLAHLLEPGRHGHRRGQRLLRPAHRRDRQPPRRQRRRGRRGLGRARPQRPRCSRRSTSTPTRASCASCTPRPRPGCEHPLAELGAARATAGDVLLMADCVTSLGGIELRFDDWGIDFAYSCSQKCVGAPPGMSPVAVSDRALERIAARSHAGPVRHRPVAAAQVLGGPAADLPPHRPRPPHLRAARGPARGRHRGARGVGGRGTGRRPLPPGRGPLARARAAGRAEFQLPQLTAVRVPDGVDGKAVASSCCATTASRSAAGSAGAPRRCGASA